MTTPGKDSYSLIHLERRVKRKLAFTPFFSFFLLVVKIFPIRNAVKAVRIPPLVTKKNDKEE